jgi:hypothetical protein
MRVSSSLEVTFHRTVRVPDGRKPSNLPPSLGRMEVFAVKDYADKCPSNWEPEAHFVALHDTEALWMSFSTKHPVALLVGAGGINALTGKKLGTTLVKDNYLVTPPQPWLDGWKDQDGTVYQFVATPYQKGKGVTVAEQLIGEESKTGAIGIALFEPKDPSKLKAKLLPHEGIGSIDGDSFYYPAGASVSFACGELLKSSGEIKSCCSTAPEMVLPKTALLTRNEARVSLGEMGVGRGGKIIQKVYADPHGLDVWKDKPDATLAVYLVNAEAFEEITGKKIPKPVASEAYEGPWFGMNDKEEADVAGTGAFTGLKSAVFPASTLTKEETKTVEK